MRILGIETSTPVISVAVGEDQQVLGEASFSTKQAHMERLLPMIDYVLKGCGMTIDDIDAFAVSVGPGSFTSLRVGLATGRAFAHALVKPLAGVPTLDVLAWGLRGISGLICTVLEARRDEVYTCFYVSTDDSIRRLSNYMAINPLKLAVRLQDNLSTRVTFTGEGAKAYWDIFREKLGEKAVLAEPAQLWPRAAMVIKLGYWDLLANGGKHPGTVSALYVKSPAIRQK